MGKLNCILLVDDDEITNFINLNLLEDMQIASRIEITTNGKEALQFLEDNFQEVSCPELILLDINMPMLDGFEFLEQFHKLELKDKDRTKMVALTTSNNPKDIKKLQNYGVNDLINKPLTKEKLEKLI